MPHRSSLAYGSGQLVILLSALLLVIPAIATPSRNNCKRVKSGQSIQKTIDSAREGDRIEVEHGVYYEQLTIKTNDISLIGKGAILKPPQAFYKNLCTGLARNLENKSTEAGICIHGKHIELAKYEQEHRKVKSVGDYIQNVYVTGFTVDGFDGENIAVVGGKSVKISNNTLNNGGRYGFLTAGSKNTLAESNIITADGPAMNDPAHFIAMCMDDHSNPQFIALCTQTSGGLVKNNKVKNCCLGPVIDPGIQGAKVIGNHISKRNPSCPKEAGAGIVISGAIEATVEGNTIEEIHNNGTGVGIFLADDLSGAVALNNLVRKNILRNNDFDIFVQSNGTNVLENNQCDPTKSAPGNYCG
jgi:nitrous oxidase accessory protein NosD